jgi:hypothetical protein
MVGVEVVEHFLAEALWYHDPLVEEDDAVVLAEAACPCASMLQGIPVGKGGAPLCPVSCSLANGCQ